MTPNGSFTTFASFGFPAGGIPRASVVEGADGNFYGTTRSGGSNGLGNVFKMTPDGTLTNLHSFVYDGDGAYPEAALVLGADHDLYGTTPDFWQSTVFKITPTGALTTLYSFAGASDGTSPAGALLLAADGNFYGVTQAGGAHEQGTVFRMTPAGALTTIYSFAGGTDGYSPVGALIQGTDGDFYGATRRNRIAGYEFYGTIFKVTSAGQLSTLYALNYTDGSYPHAGLVQGSDGNFYGTTRDGGRSSNGTFFRITPNGAFTTLVSFDGFDTGAHPESTPVEGPDGSFFGTTTTGGPGGRGTIFRLSFTAAPQITSPPANRRVVVGSNVRFSVAVFGAAPLWYQWRKDGRDLTDGGNVSGSAARILALTNVTSADLGAYSVSVSNALGSVTSGGALLTVVSPPAFQTIRLTNGTVTLTWSATAGQKYQLQCQSTLNSANWASLGSVITASNAIVTASDLMGESSQRFYRVVLSP